MTPSIPPRLEEPPVKPKRFYIDSTTDVYFTLQQEAALRGTTHDALAGKVLALWLLAGCPDFPLSDSHPSPSQLAGDIGGAE